MQAAGLQTPDQFLWRQHSSLLISEISKPIAFWHQASKNECPVFAESLASRNRPNPGVGRGDLCGRFAAKAGA